MEIVLASFCIMLIARSALTNSAKSASVPMRLVSEACLRASVSYTTSICGVISCFILDMHRL